MLVKYSYPPGVRIAVWAWGLILHEGIASDRFIGTEQAVISCSARAGAVREEPISEFSLDHGTFELERLSDLDASTVLRNARLSLGKRWELTRYNCQHFTRECYGVPVSSPQVTLGVMIIAGTAGYAVARAIRR